MEVKDHDFSESIAEASLESVLIPDSFPFHGHTLAHLAVFKKTGVQILGIKRGTQTILNPSGSDTLQIGDDILILCENANLGRFQLWLTTGIAPSTPQDS